MKEKREFRNAFIERQQEKELSYKDFPFSESCFFS